MHRNLSLDFCGVDVLPHASLDFVLPEVICWTRMQAEAGQSLQSIVARKELERRAGNGIFFWGVGNAPSRALQDYARLGCEIDVVFSTMKTPAKSRDAPPCGVTVWRTYFDAYGIERPLPMNSLVTSRAADHGGNKRAHYALMCWSGTGLRLGDLGPFDHGAYRNASAARGRVGASQVTALLRRVVPHEDGAAYRINLMAKLRYGYWVRLGDPLLLTATKRPETIDDK